MIKRTTLGGGALVALALVFVGLTILFNGTLRGWRLDLTANRLYTTAPGTDRILASIKEPINLYFFYSEKPASQIPEFATYGVRVREFLQEINRQDGTTVLLTTHDLADIETLCRRVIVIDHGRLLFDGALEQLRDRILPVTSIVFDVKHAPEAAELSWNGRPIREVGLQRYRLDIDRREAAPATAVKDLVNRFEVLDLKIEEPEIEAVVKRIYQEGIS